jgi:hypothetical protein
MQLFFAAEIIHLPDLLMQITGGARGENARRKTLETL